MLSICKLGKQYFRDLYNGRIVNGASHVTQHLTFKFPFFVTNIIMKNIKDKKKCYDFFFSVENEPF
jgi:hypothetical protein